eukprot:scaffold84621_cov63-Attheya_sp.AAC.5
MSVAIEIVVAENVEESLCALAFPSVRVHRYTGSRSRRASAIRNRCGDNWWSGSDLVVVRKCASTAEWKSPWSPLWMFSAIRSSVQSHSSTGTVGDGLMKFMSSSWVIVGPPTCFVHSDVAVHPRNGSESRSSDLCRCSNEALVVLCWKEPRS